MYKILQLYLLTIFGCPCIVHIVAGDAVEGQSLAISASDASAGVKVGTAKVVKADVMASNGVIHVIGSVLIPN